MSLPRVITVKLLKVRPEEAVHPQPRDVQRETCVCCNEPVFSQGRCKEHHAEYIAASPRHQRRKDGAL